MAVWLSWLAFAVLLGSPVLSYVPAQPANQTDGQAIEGLPINQTDTSLVKLEWYPMGSTQEQVSYQIVGNNSDGLSQGALVHFSETNLTNSTDQISFTPWIAFIACDNNATNASMDTDIFTLAQDRGAVAALMYSEWSNACVINPQYADPSQFGRLFDVFSTKKLVDAQLIESQFTNVAEPYMEFNASLLNQTLHMVNQSISGGPTGPGYLVATLLAANATQFPNGTTTGGPPQGSGRGNGGNANTGLAMIILYAITGCVSALFCVVILSGAIRAIRNPERYGARSDDPTVGGGRSRTAALGRAILDTFPIIKFGSESTQPPSQSRKPDPEHVELSERRRSTSSNHSRHIGMEDVEAGSAGAEATDPEMRERKASTSQSIEPGTPDPSRHLQQSTVLSDVDNGVDPESIGRDTCPICILDFEEGDDLRLLPCEGKHRFHQACVDPWLLEMSTSCPLCREDFLTLESMVQGAQPEPPTAHTSTSSSVRPGLIATPHINGSLPRAGRSSSLRNPRFSKYLRFAQRRRNHAVAHAASSGEHESTS